IEVVRGPDGDCTIALHGRAAACADAMGLTSLVPSLSHDGDYAGAVVVALFADAVVAQTPFETSDGSSCGAS
ncbi:MAG: Holo-[acyl-carrier-protein] synthase, partial [Polaromonas sp.]|nr:Holo-[acyl-carrier-protein] synthase [Polaromonas sp.]